MSPRSAAAAVARSAGAAVPAPGRPRTRPAPARRRSGASARTRARTTTLPAGTFLPLLDRLLRGPAYIGVVGLLLAGIVFFNVDVLELNHGIARTDQRAAQLKRQNAALTLRVAKLGSSERIQRMALEQGLVLPQPGDVRYLRARPSDAGRALRVMTAPDPSSAAAAVQTTVSQVSESPDGTTAPATTAPATTAPVTTAPETTAPATTAPVTTEPTDPTAAAAGQ